jgi:predicted DsbA family dithiol-disulfide isomerase
MDAAPLLIDVFSDVVCPWCFIGKRRLERALDLFAQEHAQSAAPLVRWNAFQLNPDLALGGVSREQYLSEKFGNHASEIYERVKGVGQTVGIDFRFDLIAHQPNTLKAHSLLVVADSPQLQWRLKEALLQAYFIDGANLSLDSTLSQIASDVGLSHANVQAALFDEGIHQAVRDKDRSARALGINGVPFFIFNGTLGVSGAQDESVLLQAMNEAIAGA